MAAASTLATHLLNQTLDNIATLESLAVISTQDASLIRSKVPHPGGPFPSLNGPSGPPSLPPRMKPETRARALWDYNGTEGDDLRFRAGDELVVVEEGAFAFQRPFLLSTIMLNDQWWRGKVVGSTSEKIGLFPSNYVEKLRPDASSSPSQCAVLDSADVREKQLVYSSPPPTQYQHQYQPQTYHAQPSPLYQAPEKHRFSGSGLGAQMGTAVVHGAGFGVGSSLASHAVNAIL